MKSRILILVTVFIIASMAMGCGGGADPVGVRPESSPAVQATDTSRSNHVLWGLWHCYMEPGGTEIEIEPLRTAQFTANVNNLLEASPGNLLIEDIDATNFLTEGRLDCTIRLRHPLPGLGQYHGFDVWGVFMHNGSATLDYDSLVYSDGTGVNEALLLNPDGYTRWFNYTEFNGHTLPVLEYWPGRLGNIPAPTATLNPYKIFADGLDTYDDYYQWIIDPANSRSRGIYRAGVANTRRYELKFPIIGSAPVVDFQYAVVATWEPGDPTLTGNPTVYDPGDFPTSANCEEAFFIHADTSASSLYYVDPGNNGGNLVADIEVFDWQGGSIGGNGVPNEVERIILEGDFLPGGSTEFTHADLLSIASPGTENSSVFQVEVVGCSPQASGEADFWMIVEGGGLNGDTYGQGYPTEYPERAHRAAFSMGTVTVSNESPLHVIYVDDSNTTGVEDGTQGHPYNTIQEGVDAAALLEDYEVWVDDSGNPYVEQVNMAVGTVLRSINWDESDGGNRAFIDGPDDPESYSVWFDGVDDVLLDGFRIGFAGIWPMEWPYDEGTRMIGIEGGTGITVQDCLFTGQTDIESVYPIIAIGASDLTISHCRMASIDKGSDPTACAFFRGVSADNCVGLTVQNCVFTDIRSSEDETSKGFEMCYLINSTEVVVKNCLAHHVIPHAGVGTMGAVLMEGFHFEGCSAIQVVNNTVDTMDSSDAFFINQSFGYVFDGCSALEFANNIATRIYSSGSPPPLARGVQATGCTVVCDFTDVWDVQASYYGGASAGIGAISANPLYIDPDNEEYDLSSGSPAQQGDPDFVDWDDAGPPSGDPGDTDPDTRSRMGCHGGPGGEIVGLLTPE